VQRPGVRPGRFTVRYSGRPVGEALESGRPGSGVDAHQHFWDPGRHHYPWLTDERAAIRRPFGPEHLRPLLARHGIGRTVVVEARSTLEETRELLQLAAATEFVAGVVGWVDLREPDLEGVLAGLRAARGGERLVGIRHPIREEPDRAWISRPETVRGLRVLAEHQLVFDLLVAPAHLEATLAAVRAVPQLTFVVEHMGGPGPRGPEPAWEVGMAALAGCPNVVCKLSGLAIASCEGLQPLADRLLDWFGEDRLLFGSDWPVCLLSTTYDQVLERLDCLLRDLPAAARDRVRGGNAARVYRLPEAQAARKATPNP
jgi:L-fuconolactonase